MDTFLRTVDDLFTIVYLVQLECDNTIADYKLMINRHVGRRRTHLRLYTYYRYIDRTRLRSFSDTHVVANLNLVNDR